MSLILFTINIAKSGMKKKKLHYFRKHFSMLFPGQSDSIDAKISLNSEFKHTSSAFGYAK